MKIRLFSFLFPFVLGGFTNAAAMEMAGMDHSGKGMSISRAPVGNSMADKNEKTDSSPEKAMHKGQAMAHRNMADMGDMSGMEDMGDMADMDGMDGMADMHHMKRPPQQTLRNRSGPADEQGQTGQKVGSSSDGRGGGKAPAVMGDMVMPAAGLAVSPVTGPTTARPTVSEPAKTPRIVHKVVDAPAPVVDLGHHIHGMDMGTWFHGVLDEFEGRYQGGGNSSLRWDGEAWYGGDYNRLWLKSEGTMTRGRVHDGDQELLYSRAISTYFNLQGGVRLDLDSGPTRAWGAVGVEGLALYQFEVQATGYFNDRGVAGRLEGSYDILLTNRLILQPQVELNFYSHADRQRLVGSGLADIDTGLRLRYELWRKMAPYVAVTYDSPLMQGRHMARQQGERASEARFTFGIRSWF